MLKDGWHIQIYSMYDGWEIQLLDKENSVKGRWTWSYEDFEAGVGGEKYFKDILNTLGHTTYQEDIC